MKKTKGFSVVGVVVGILAVGFIAYMSYLVIDGNSKATNFNDYDFHSYIGPDEHNGNIGDHVKGDKDAPVLIFEYADYQCEHCASINTRVNAAVEKANGKLGVVYRNFLLSYHQNGTAAASAALAAGLQEVEGIKDVWKEYSNRLFAAQEEWYYATASTRTDIFVRIFEEATDGKGDVDKFREDLASPEVSKRISFDMGIGKRLEIPGTPTFYVDGQYINWSNSEGGSVVVNGKTVSWDHGLTGSEFTDLLLEIVDAKTSS